VVKITGVDAPMAILDATDPLDGDTVVARKTTLVATVTTGLDRTLRVVKNGEILIGDIAVDADPFRYELEVEAPSEGEDRYRLEVLEGNSRVTVTSHVWVKRPEGSSGGGCSVALAQRDQLETGGAPGELVGLLLVGLLLWRRRR
jgi:MYXO-CTERM domain-containing protein